MKKLNIYAKHIIDFLSSGILPTPDYEDMKVLMIGHTIAEDSSNAGLNLDSTGFGKFGIPVSHILYSESISSWVEIRTG